MHRKEEYFDIVIIGAGLAGLLVARYLNYFGIKTALVDRKKIQNSSKDPRTTALNFRSREFLDKIGIWQELESFAAAINDILILNNHSDTKLHFPHGNVSDAPMGHIVNNYDFYAALIKDLDKLENVTIFSEQEYQDIKFFEEAFKSRR